MFFFKKKKKKLEIYAPISGNLIKIEAVEDLVFADKMLGDGFAIVPDEVKNVTFLAPFSGKLVTVFDTGHAYGILDNNTKIECLIHIGLDTVELKGTGFAIKVKQDEIVTLQQPLVTVNLKILKSKNKAVVTPIIFTKETMELNNYHLNVLKEGKIKQGDLIAEIIKN